MTRQNQIIALVAVLALVAGFVFASRFKQPAPAQPGAAEALLTAQLKDTQEETHSLTQYRGKVLVVNFWATWCPPCREEIPLFIQAQTKFASNGLQFVGIALDNPQKVANFAQEFAINYPVLIGGINESEALRKLGDPGGGLPFTLIYDRKGNLREKVLGGLDKQRLEQLIAPLI